ncbi:MAG TPA: TetR/AcrR family transcriptional regulator [Acidimicrobiales bacterium]|nr:TetR/AcrR family transcriptional regulator [Acidimicrobiales bacterium]
MPSKRGRGADPDMTRRRLLDAAVATLDRDSYAGATARAVAAAAGCNQASIYYHFGGMPELLVAALVDSNERRFAAYREALAPLDDPTEIIAAWRELHDEDVRSGHIGAMTELVGATGAEPRLRAGVTQAMGAWRELIAGTIRRAVAGGPLAAVVPVDEATDLILAAFLGVELLGHLDGDRDRPGRLLAAGQALATLVPAGRTGA